MVPIPSLSTVAAIVASYEARDKQYHRSHLGASEIGHPCERKLWYGFRWVGKEVLGGQKLRLFETGKLQEQRLLNDLQAVGVKVFLFDMKTGKQFSFSLAGGHFGGSIDAVLVGLVESPKTPHLGEFKTHNEKSFKDLLRKGVKESKPDHWAQMQVYMNLARLRRAYYLAVNKNTDELYGERIYYDRKAAKGFIEKAMRIIFTDKPPTRISDKADYFICKMCSFREICHQKELTAVPPVNCRTCLHVSAEQNGDWTCARFAAATLSLKLQRLGCGHHLFNPYLFPCEPVGAEGGTEDEESVVYQINGRKVVNRQGGKIEA